MALSQDQINFFGENGYLPWTTILTPEEVAALRTEYDAVFAAANHDGRFRNLATPVADGPPQPARRMLQIMQMCERSLAFRRLIYDARILDVIADLLGPNLMLFHDQALFKPAGDGGAVFWHQDNGYWKCRPANLISCWLTLDDVDVHNGAMHVIPGSHLKPATHEQAKATQALLESQVDESRAVVVPLPAGACMFHHCQTLHYTPPNTTDRQRRAFAIHVMAPGTRDAKGAVMPVSFGRPLLRAAW
jgi:phytanoyl-CoA hydroxylase